MNTVADHKDVFILVLDDHGGTLVFAAHYLIRDGVYMVRSGSYRDQNVVQVKKAIKSGKVTWHVPEVWAVEDLQRVENMAVAVVSKRKSSKRKSKKRSSRKSRK